MLEIKEKKECCGCSACANVCPQKCIIMEEDKEGFIYPTTDTKACIQCNLCRQVCPVLNDDRSTSFPYLSTYAAYCLDNKIRQLSSSGGIFYILAKLVIEAGGIVFGVRLSEDCRSAYHVSAKTEKELFPLLGSKYLQSNINNCFSEAKQYLEEGKQVLFVGTPCQIEGLKKFLRKDYSSLICIDFICHGIPSPKTWRKYIEYWEKQENSTVLSVQFRNKKFGWRKYCLTMKFKNGNIYCRKHADDLYMNLFLNNISMRPSCYSCSFRKTDRISDITIADFWGIEYVIPEMDEDEGTSLLIVHSIKGKDMLDAVKDQIKLEEVQSKSIFSENPSLNRQPRKPLLRQKYFKNIERISIETAGSRYLWPIKWKKKLRTIKKRIIRYLQSFRTNGKER